jgi:hypothetical protein
MDEVGHVVYFVQFGPYVKIGHTGRLHSRLKQLKRSPKDLGQTRCGEHCEDRW